MVPALSSDSQTAQPTCGSHSAPDVSQPLLVPDPNLAGPSPGRQGHGSDHGEPWVAGIALAFSGRRSVTCPGHHAQGQACRRAPGRPDCWSKRLPADAPRAMLQLPHPHTGRGPALERGEGGESRTGWSLPPGTPAAPHHVRPPPSRAAPSVPIPGHPLTARCRVPGLWPSVAHHPPLQVPRGETSPGLRHPGAQGAARPRESP